MNALTSKSVLLVIGGGIAAYKSLDLIRRLQDRGASVRVILTTAAQEFVTPLAAGALTADKVFTDLFDREDEQDVGHIRLARDSDLVIVAPATADLMAKMTSGLANDLATAVLLARQVPVLLAPAMNPAMWSNRATQRNRATLVGDGVNFIGPATGEMAEKGEAGLGRMAEVADIIAAAQALVRPAEGALTGRRALVTAGPTREPIDPVRYIANRSSGKQGFAIAAALARQGADVTLISGPVTLSTPPAVDRVSVETAEEMLEAVEAALPVDIAVMVAAVSDWRAAMPVGSKIKKRAGQGAPQLVLTENPDILATVSIHAQRPHLVIGFAAETDDLMNNAQAKLARKGCDAIVANDVSRAADGTSVMGGDHNKATLLTKSGATEWPEMSKAETADHLVRWVAENLETDE